jgi:hypothetical protein
MPCAIRAPEQEQITVGEQSATGHTTEGKRLTRKIILQRLVI